MYRGKSVSANVTNPLISGTTCIETLQIKDQQLNKMSLFIQTTETSRLEYAGNIWWDTVNLNVCWDGCVFREKLKRVLRYFCLMSEFTLAAYIHDKPDKMINDETKTQAKHLNSFCSSLFNKLLQTKQKKETFPCLKKRKRKVNPHLWAALLIFPLISTTSTELSSGWGHRVTWKHFSKSYSV